MTTQSRLQTDAESIARSLESWFDDAKRDLPWRRRPRSRAQRGYNTLVAEAMLQQTQVSRVVDRFERFVEKFPNVQALAAADEQDVLALWQGLGYYRRARNLLAAARVIVDEFDGVVPADVDGLLTLPGVGRYTAGAIASIAYDRHVPIVDGNVMRVIARLTALEEPTESRDSQKLIWEAATELVEACNKPARFNQALMELGSTVCLPRSPRCDACPVGAHCAAMKRGIADRIPVPKRAPRQLDIHAASIVIRKRGRCLLTQRPASGLWASLWQAPTVESDTPIDQSAIAEFMVNHVGLKPRNGTLTSQLSFMHQTSHRRVRFEVWVMDEFTGRKRAGVWVNHRQLADYPISNAQRKILSQPFGFGFNKAHDRGT